MEKRGVAAFDFDGTITRKDTLLEFIKFVKGVSSCYRGLLLYAPLLVAYKLKLYPNWKVKQRFFAHFFKQRRIRADVLFYIIRITLAFFRKQIINRFLAVIKQCKRRKFVVDRIVIYKSVAEAGRQHCVNRVIISAEAVLFHIFTQLQQLIVKHRSLIDNRKNIFQSFKLTFADRKNYSLLFCVAPAERNQNSAARKSRTRGQQYDAHSESG